MTYEDIHYDVASDGVATLTINRPEVMNALRPQTSARDARGRSTTCATNDAVRCLRRSPARAAASAPATTSRPSSSPRTAPTARSTARSAASSTARRRSTTSSPSRSRRSPPSTGPPSATAWTSRCTATSASPPTRAKFGWYFVRRGVVGTIGGTFILRQLVGLSKAFELTLTGDLVDAEEALRIGLVSKVVPDDELMDEARALARKLASGRRWPSRPIKRAMHKGFEMDWRTLGEYQQALGDVLWETDDHMEGVQLVHGEAGTRVQGPLARRRGVRADPVRGSATALPAGPAAVLGGSSSTCCGRARPRRHRPAARRRLRSRRPRRPAGAAFDEVSVSTPSRHARRGRRHATARASGHAGCRHAPRTSPRSICRRCARDVRAVVPLDRPRAVARARLRPAGARRRRRARLTPDIDAGPQPDGPGDRRSRTTRSGAHPPLPRPERRAGQRARRRYEVRGRWPAARVRPAASGPRARPARHRAQRRRGRVQLPVDVVRRAAPVRRPARTDVRGRPPPAAGARIAGGRFWDWPGDTSIIVAAKPS